MNQVVAFALFDALCGLFPLSCNIVNLICLILAYLAKDLPSSYLGHTLMRRVLRPRTAGLAATPVADLEARANAIFAIVNEGRQQDLDRLVKYCFP